MLLAMVMEKRMNFLGNISMLQISGAKRFILLFKSLGGNVHGILLQNEPMFTLN